MEEVRQYTRKKLHKMKDDNEAQAITLIMRQYYGNENFVKRNQKLSERYYQDEEYRAYKKMNAKLSYYRRKAAKLERDTQKNSA
jgi:hypothetical protein